MGIYYSFALKVGYSVDLKEFIRLFGKIDEGNYHLEDRFDPKTGAKIQSEKIWDKKPKNYLQIGQDRFESIFDIIYHHKLNNTLGCVVDMSNTNEEILHFTMSPPCKLKKEYIGNDSLISGPITINTLQEMLPELLELKQRLKNLGLNVGNPEVFIASSAG